MLRSRRGFSLMEVMLSTSILVGSSIVLIELATIGRKQANSAYDLNTAQLLCQAKLNEIVAKATSAKPVQEEELENDPGWFYSIEIEPARHRRLVSVKVTVSQEADDSRKPASFTLVRWMPDSILESADGMPSNGTRATSTEPRSMSTESDSSASDSSSQRRPTPPRNGATEGTTTNPRRPSRREDVP